MTNENERKRRDWSGVIIGAVILPVYLVFHFLGKEDMGRTAALVLGMSLLAVRLRWKLRKHVWFWATVIAVFCLHIPLILRFRWPDRWISGTELLPFGLADLLIMLGCIWLVEKVATIMTRPTNPNRPLG